MTRGLPFMQIRRKIIEAIDALLEQKSQQMMESEQLRKIYESFQANPFTLDSLAYCSLVHPDDGAAKFDVGEHLSGIHPISSMEPLEPHLVYVKSFLEKQEGREALCVDVHLLPESYVICLR